MKRIIIISALFALLAINVEALDCRTFIIENPESPITVEKAEMWYGEQGPGWFDKGTEYALNAKLEYVNTAGKEITASCVTIVIFDFFDDHVSTNRLMSDDEITLGDTSKGTWGSNFYGDFSSHTGIFYVSAVRFSDDTIWRVDTSYVLSELNRIVGEEFTKDILEPTKTD